MDDSSEKTVNHDLPAASCIAQRAQAIVSFTALRFSHALFCGAAVGLHDSGEKEPDKDS